MKNLSGIDCIWMDSDRFEMDRHTKGVCNRVIVIHHDWCIWLLTRQAFE